eukprot:scaffold18016_cov65-Phaeocystis_antarctica.AAC.4
MVLLGGGRHRHVLLRPPARGGRGAERAEVLLAERVAELELALHVSAARMFHVVQLVPRRRVHDRPRHGALAAHGYLAARRILGTLLRGLRHGFRETFIGVFVHGYHLGDPSQQW